MIAYHAAAAWRQQGDPIMRARDLYGLFFVGVTALELAGWDKVTEAVKHDPLLLKLAEQHRPVVRPLRDFTGEGPETWKSVQCKACNTGWRVWAPGDVPFRCDIWQELLEKGIVSE